MIVAKTGKGTLTISQMTHNHSWYIKKIQPSSPNDMILRISEATEEITITINTEEIIAVKISPHNNQTLY